MIAISKPWDFSLMRKFDEKENNKKMERMNQIRIGMIGVGAGWIAIIGKFGQSQINFLKYDLISSLKQSQKK